MRLKIAVVGAGIAGLSAAWLLARHHDVTLFEANAYLGGHTNTIDVSLDGIQYPVDTGFLVYNDWTYPNLIEMFRVLNVETAASDMSFSVSLNQGALEWAGSDSAWTTFAQPTNLLRPAFWRMLKDMFRFNREASALALSNAIPAISLGEYLDRHHYGKPFREWYLMPMAACIWSTPSQRINEFPLATFVHFCANHGLLSVNNRPKWRTVKAGARNYVQKIAATLADVRLSSPVTQIQRAGQAVWITSARGRERFDHAVLAAHTDQSLALLTDASNEERSMLVGIPYQSNRAFLHTDASFMPQRKKAWAAWNFQSAASALSTAPVSLTYWLNRLQPLPFKRDVFVTLNPARAVSNTELISEIAYDHPAYLSTAPAAQALLTSVQGQRNTWYCGAWTRYGFHEDGLMSGIKVAQALGAEIPWTATL